MVSLRPRIGAIAGICPGRLAQVGTLADMEDHAAEGADAGFGRNEFVRSLATGLSVLESFTPLEPRLTVSEVAQRSGVSRATARRMMLTLASLGYAHSDGRHFELTPKVLGLGRGYWSGRGWHELLRPWLDSLSASVGESCSAAILAEDDVMYVCRVHTRRIMRIDLGLGTRLPAFATSMGRVLLAGLESHGLGRRLECMDRPQLTEHTLTDPARLAEEVARAREVGHAVVDEELELGLRSVAVPVHDAEGRTVLALNTSMSAGREPLQESVERVLPALKASAASVEELVHSLGREVDRLVLPTAS